MRILLVDDDDALLSFLAKELESRDCDVYQSSSGDEAFRVCQRLAPWELVLTDYRFFPGAKIKDGVQLAAAIHEISPLQTMAIMTADPQGSARESAGGFAPPPGAQEALPAGASAATAAADRAAVLIRMGSLRTAHFVALLVRRFTSLVGVLALVLGYRSSSPIRRLDLRSG